MKPLLVIAWGNRSRGDDALGPLLLDALGECLSTAQAARVDLIECHQLQPELAIDLVGRERVLFADADPSALPPFDVRGVSAQRDRTLASHSLSPAALLAVFEQLQGAPAPPATLLALPAQAFALGATPSRPAQAALRAARSWALRWIDGSA